MKSLPINTCLANTAFRENFIASIHLLENQKGFKNSKKRSSKIKMYENGDNK